MGERASLEQIRSALRGALLVSSRLLRHVIKAHKQVYGIGLAVPHAQSYLLARKDFRRIVHERELEMETESLPDPVLLLEEPDNTWLAQRDPASALQHFWGEVFHLRVHGALEALVNARELTPHAVKRLVHRLGQVEFDGARAVLIAENLIRAGAPETEVFIELVASFLQLKHFEPEVVGHFFPQLETALLPLLEELELAVPDLLAESRPRNAPPLPETGPAEAQPPKLVPTSVKPTGPLGQPAPDSPRSARREALISRARAAEHKGNRARAVVLLRKSLTFRASDPQVAEVRQQIERLLHGLAACLHATLQIQTEADWYAVLCALAIEADLNAHSYWSQKVRLLYDLQSACHDANPAETVDLVGWALSWGRLPIRRRLALRPPVLVYRHLQRGSKRLPKLGHVSCYPALRKLLGTAVRQAAAAVRQQLGPQLEEALEEVGLVAAHRVDIVARRKIVAELLDVVLERGHIQLSDLRDAFSRNPMKLKDLAGIGELLHGDVLLKADRVLSLRLDGVYHRGEVYMRGLQKGISVMFGTALGRFVFLYLLLPLGGGFLVLEGMKHLFAPLIGLLGIGRIHALSQMQRPLLQALGGAHTLLLTGWALLSSFFLALLASGAFRRRVARVSVNLGKALKQMWAVPVRWLRHPRVMRVLNSAFVFYSARYFVQPLLFAWLASALLPLSWKVELLYLALIFTGVAVAATTLVWRRIEARVLDALVSIWRGIRYRLLPNIYEFVVSKFQRFLEWVDVILYAVDERLRFRRGDGPLKSTLKAIGGVLWFLLTYLVRLYVKVLVEPQVNPIKHFPVVTVTHKLMLPASGILLHLFATPLTPFIGGVAANAIAGFNVLLLPGVAGFLAWELKEGWKLYASNRPRTLQPAMIGTHGETLAGLLKPGLHSGTVPRLYKRLRAAAIRHERRRARQAEAALDLVRRQVRRFVARDLLEPLKMAPNERPDIELGAIQLASNRVQIELLYQGRHALISLEEQSLVLLAGWSEPGWITDIPEQPRQTFRAALAGFYKLAGVELVREQVEQALGGPAAYDVCDGCLNVWPVAESPDEAQYPLSGELLRPRVVVGEPNLPPLPADQLLFWRNELSWSDWVAQWEGARENLLPGVPLLPASTMPSEAAHGV